MSTLKCNVYKLLWIKVSAKCINVNLVGNQEHCPRPIIHSIKG